MKTYRIGVILPAYNEARVIDKVLASIPKTSRKNNQEVSYVAIVIDDGSVDKTTAIVKAAKHGVLIRHIINCGPGAATRTGLEYLRDNGFDYGATMDADGQHSFASLQTVVEALISSEADIVIGSRLINKAGDMPLHKVVGNKGLNVITQLLLGVKSTDSQSGLKAFNRNAIERLDYRENGYAFCSEIIWRAKKANLKFAEVPVSAVYTKYSKSKGQNNWNAFNIMWSLVNHRVRDFIRG